MSRRHKLTCGFEELSLSVLKYGGMSREQGAPCPQPFFACAIPLPKNHPFGNKLFTKNMYHYLSIAHI